MANKLKWMSLKQKKVYQHLTAKLWSAGDTKASTNAYRQLLEMSEYDIEQYIRKIEGKPTDAGLMEKLRQMYTDSELELLARGANITADHTVRITSESKHHKIGVMSDTHVGSKFTPHEWIEKAIATMEQEGCECILHCGDVTEGIKAPRKNEQVNDIEPDCITYPGMRAGAIHTFEHIKIPMHVISGNHDRFFQDRTDIVGDICDKVELMHFAGHDNAIVEFDGAKVALFHGEDGYSNTRLERICYKVFNVSINNISMVLAGHVHKFEIKKFDATYAIHVPALQARSNWMMSKKLTADCGFLIIEFDVIDRHIYNLKAQYYNL